MLPCLTAGRLPPGRLFAGGRRPRRRHAQALAPAAQRRPPPPASKKPAPRGRRVIPPQHGSKAPERGTRGVSCPGACHGQRGLPSSPRFGPAGMDIPRTCSSRRWSGDINGKMAQAVDKVRVGEDDCDFIAKARGPPETKARKAKLRLFRRHHRNKGPICADRDSSNTLCRLSPATGTARTGLSEFPGRDDSAGRGARRGRRLPDIYLGFGSVTH